MLRHLGIRYKCVFKSFYDFVIRHSVITNPLFCVGASWCCQSIASWKHSLENDQSMFVCTTPPTFIWKWWNICMLAGINIYEQISFKSDTCIYLMCKETQLTKMIIIYAFQCYSGSINKHRYQRGPLWVIAIRSFWNIV